MSIKPKVALFVLCSRERTGWINPRLVRSLMQLAAEPSLDFRIEMVMDRRPVEHARNVCIVDARERGADMCVQIDNDMTIPHDFTDIIHDALATNKHVVALRYGVLYDDGPKIIPLSKQAPAGRFRDAASPTGGGVLLISSEVWRVISQGPWFRWISNNDETLSFHTGEDFYFCNYVQACGLDLWTHDCEAGHLKTSDITRWATRVMHLQKEFGGGPEEMSAYIDWRAV